MRKPNFIQRWFIDRYFKTHNRVVDCMVRKNYYVVTSLYTHKYHFCIRYEECDSWIKELEQIGWKIAVVNNVLFIW